MRSNRENILAKPPTSILEAEKQKGHVSMHGGMVAWPDERLFRFWGRFWLCEVWRVDPWFVAKSSVLHC